MNMQLEFPACIARAAAALQQLCAVIEEPNCASAELAEARRWLLAAHEAAVRSCPPTVVAYLAYRTEWFAQAAALRILAVRRSAHTAVVRSTGEGSAVLLKAPTTLGLLS